MIDNNDFEAWREGIVAEAFYRAIEQLAEQAKEKWVQASWDGRNPDPRLLAECRGMVEAFQTVMKLTVEDINEANRGRGKDQTRR